MRARVAFSACADGAKDGRVAGFPDRFLEELKYKCDIVSVISQYVPLVKKGNKYFCCCPFHNEKTPSMCVNTDGQYYHCFGCGVSGDVITFVMEMESVSYVDAVRLLAERAGMELPEYHGDGDYKKKKDRRETLKALMKDAARYYHNNLMSKEAGAQAREYLAGRGLTEDICKRFGIGLSLGYDQMPGYMRRKGYSVENLRACGLVVGERISDAFAGRIIVPIMNGMGDVIAFGGRIYRGEADVAKYKNSTNTELFDKSRCVYGVNFVKKEKRRGNAFGNLILVEGYMDVISLASAGFMNAVAGMGTALTPQQAREIKRLTDTVYVCYDGDAAGKKAAVRNVEPLIAEGLEVRVVSLAEGLDPDDTVKKEGADGFRKRLEAALPVIEYKLKLCEDAYDLRSASGRAKYVTAALRVLSSIQSAAEREVYLGIVSSKSGVSVNTLAEQVAGARQPAAVASPREEPKDGGGRILRAARFVLNRIISNAPYASCNDVKEEWMPLPEHAAILRFARSKGDGKIVAGEMFGTDAENAETGKVFGAETDFGSDAKEKTYYADCVKVLEERYSSERIAELTAKYKELTDAEEKRAVLMEIQKLQRKLKSKNVKEKV